jgi:hypothetical protein
MQSFDPFFTNTKLMSHNAAHACFNPTPFSPISPASALVVLWTTRASDSGTIFPGELFRMHNPVVEAQ